jgi:hypothetical protein
MPEIVLNRYKLNQPAKEERPSSSESSKSLLDAQDWKKIERLLKEVVTDVYDKRVQKLNDTIQESASADPTAWGRNLKSLVRLQLP